MGKTNILITSAGKRVSLVRAFQKELKNYDKESKVYTADANPNLSSACHISERSIKLPKVNHKNFLKILIAECSKNEIKLVIPTIDTELLLLAENKDLLKRMGIDVVISSLEFVKKCRDKRLIHDFFDSKGIEVAKEYDKDQLEFPLFIKPSDGSRSVDTFFIRTKEDLTDYHFQNEKFMFLEYIDQTKFVEYTCDLYYNKEGELKCAVPRKRIEVRDGEVSKGKTTKNELLTLIKKKLSKIEGVRGCLTAQFFFNEETKRIVAIEINPRFGGGYPLSYRAGANFPKMLMEEYFMNKKIKYFENWKKNLLMLRYDDEVLIENYVE